MANFEKIIKMADAICDCIPIVSSLTNSAHLLYKLAHKVDAQNPVAPGLKTSLKIHSLNKENVRCFLSAVPMLGNFFKLAELIIWVKKTISRCSYFDFDTDALGGNILMRALRSKNQEILHLLSQNNLNEPFWKRKTSCALASVIQERRMDLVNTVISIIPNGTPFEYLKTILYDHSAPHRGYGDTVDRHRVLTSQQVKVLIAKSAPPTQEELDNYWAKVNQRENTNREIRDSFFHAQNDIKSLLIDQAHLTEEQKRQLTNAHAGI